MLVTQSIRNMLAGGIRSSIGRADEVAELVRRRPALAPKLVECLWDLDETIVARAANALEKVSRDIPPILKPHKSALLGLMAEADQKELRWQLALMVPRLPLKPAECTRVAAALESWLEDSSSLVKTFAMQGLADLIRQSPSLEPMVLDILRTLSRSGTAAMRARGRILLRHMETAARQKSNSRSPQAKDLRG
jgi:hypothetical protein